jgi:hypothetical protein
MTTAAPKRDAAAIKRVKADKGDSPTKQKREKRVVLPTGDEWRSVRAEFEAGATVQNLSLKYNISATAINRRRSIEGWRQDAEAAIKMRTQERLAKIQKSQDPVKRDEAIENEAQARANVIHRHRREWDTHAVLLDETFARRDFNLAKLTKITAEILMIRQSGERKAWNIDTVTQNININATGVGDAVNLKGLSDDELAVIIRGEGQS